MADGATAAWLSTLPLRSSALPTGLERRGLGVSFGRITRRDKEHRERGRAAPRYDAGPCSCTGGEGPSVLPWPPSPARRQLPRGHASSQYEGRPPFDRVTRSVNLPKLINPSCVGATHHFPAHTPIGGAGDGRRMHRASSIFAVDLVQHRH